jgi:hypothetical protein
MHADEQAALVTEVRWHAAATLVVLPLLVLGLVDGAVIAFTATEIGLAAARRRPAVQARRSARRSPQAS